MVQSQELKALTISQLAAEGGVGVETIRFYQRKGLIDTPARDGGIRRYGAEAVRRLRFVRRAQTAGFTLEEIAELLRLDATRDHHRARELADSRLQAIAARIAELELARTALSTLSRRCSDNLDAPCPILASFDV